MVAVLVVAVMMPAVGHFSPPGESGPGVFLELLLSSVYLTRANHGTSFL
jgi:hypothetical protein